MFKKFKLVLLAGATICTMLSLSLSPTTHAEAKSTAAQPSESVTINAVIGDDYPYKNDSWNSADPWGFYKRNCTSFVAHRMNNNHKFKFTNYMNGGHWGNANNWDNNARALGYTVNKTPKVGAIAQWNSGSYGHVAYVAEVRNNGTEVVIEEYNWATKYGYGKRTLSTSSVENFIHVLPGSSDEITGTVHTDNGLPVNVRSGPGTSYSIVGKKYDGDVVTIECQIRGETVTGKYGTSDLWNRIGTGQYISDTYVYTGSDGQVAPTCPSP